MNYRLKRLFEELPHHSNIDALLITQDVNIQYLTGFPAHESWLLAMDHKVIYITDFRYIEEAKQGLKGIALVKQHTQCLSATLFDLVKKYRIKRLGFDER